MLAGQSFSYPCMLSQCPKNVLNALTMRHLSLAPNCCVARLYNPFLTVFKHRIRAVVFQTWPEVQNGEWRIGKSMHKLMNIDRSRLYDNVAPNKSKAFAKKEINVAVPTKARLIQGNSNEHTAYEHPEEYHIMNAVMKSIGDETFEVCGVRCRFVYAGGKNHTQLSALATEFLARGNVVIDERDGKNWDATMNERLLSAEAQVYDMLKLRSAARFLQRCAKVRGIVMCQGDVGVTIIKYLTAWKRLSGDWNTSVGNTIISMIIVYTVLKNLPPHLRPREMLGLFMGDDYLGFMQYVDPVDHKALAGCLNDVEASCGITPQRALFTDPLKISFCSLTLWPRRDGGYQFVPNPGKQLAKLFWARDGTFQSRLQAYRATIAESFWKTFHGFELMQKFLKHHHAGSARVVLDRYVTEPLVSEVADIDWRAGFVYKYGIPFDALSFDYPLDDGVWHHPAIEHMIRIESLDPQDRAGALGC